MTFLIELIREILLGGLETIVAFTSWDFIDAYPWLELPGLPWTIVAAGAAILSYKLSGQRISFVCRFNNGSIFLYLVNGNLLCKHFLLYLLQLHYHLFLV